MTAVRSPTFTARYWVLGGRWADGARHLPWPRVYGPFDDLSAAQACADAMNAPGGRRVRYHVVADVADAAA
ncbi:MAG TPA: hypothetical protein VG939_00595 [Caulobacteraceae bacterium]|nr:hypothetical protein [Caulobacteraceae bacterium]